MQMRAILGENSFTKSKGKEKASIHAYEPLEIQVDGDGKASYI